MYIEEVATVIKAINEGKISRPVLKAANEAAASSDEEVKWVKMDALMVEFERLRLSKDFYGLLLEKLLDSPSVEQALKDVVADNGERKKGVIGRFLEQLNEHTGKAGAGGIYVGQAGFLEQLNEHTEKTEDDQKTGKGEESLSEEFGALKETMTAIENETYEDEGKNKKKDWTDYRCKPYEVDFSRSITDANNYTGEFYSRFKCESEARSLFQGIYREAETMIQKQHLLDLATGEIVYYADECFEEEKIRLQRECPELDSASVDQCLDLHKFREEAEERLKNIRPAKIRDLDYYLNMVEYEDSDGYQDDKGPLIGLLFSVKESWNYNGYEAYKELERDTQEVCDRYAEEATKIAKTALKKRIGWLRELEKKAGPAD